jgi:hypothetical protein
MAELKLFTFGPPRLERDGQPIDLNLPFRAILELLTGDVEARTAVGGLPYDQADRLWHTLTVTTQALLEVGPDLLDTFIPAPPAGSGSAAAPEGAGWRIQLHELAASTAGRSERDLQ